MMMATRQLHGTDRRSGMRTRVPSAPLPTADQARSTCWQSGQRQAWRLGHRRALVLVLLAVLLASSALAQAIEGTFEAVDGDARLSFRAHQGAPGSVEGTYADTQLRLTLSGVADDDGAYGLIDETDLAFEAYVAGDRLVLYVYELDARGDADMATVQELFFTRVPDDPPVASAPAPPAAPQPGQQAPDAGVQGVDLVAGQEYGPGTRVRIGGLGVSLQIPDGWAGGMQLGQSVMLFGSHTLPGLVLVMPFKGSSIDEVQAGVAQPIDLGDGVVLQATAPERSGMRVRTPLTGFGPQGPLLGHAVATVGDASGVLILVVDAVASGRDEAFYRDTAERFAQGLQFGAPTVVEHDAIWQQQLAGTMLRYQSGGGGTGSTGSGFVQASATAHLCSDGSFHYAGRSSVSATVPGVTALGADASELTGQWRVSALGPEQALLIGHDTLGGSHLWVVNAVGHEFYVNGERWSRAPSDACR